ncbi:AMP-binding protein [Streptomyces sp. NBC_00654]|uniref:AMP-binding protein n=1 Tax=Streptomyces sp. NBC_00654 TaxID=2975799 RepID=UPI0022513901|nr:AMP-binding protein [Streptomyces sp. NBC_00654]MCX4966046.1 AMP-binding protein [Streptomyces sp. NBC_00654]
MSDTLPGTSRAGVGDAGDRIEFASRDEITALQLTRLRGTLAHVYSRVPHYRSVFDGVGFHPSELRELSDLARIPFTTKEDLRANYPFGMLAVPRRDVARLHASSGTTGLPTVIGYDREDISIWSDVMARCLRAGGVRPGDTVHVACGYGLFTGGLGAHYGAERLGCTVVPASGGMTERQVRLIADFRPDAVVVTPSYLLVLADAMKAGGMDPAACSLSYALLGGEPWTEGMRTEMEQALGLEATDLYGLSEVMGPGVACECVEAKDGLVVWEDHFFPEIVDPVDGTPLPDGQFGELVLTTLSRRAMPVVRYRTRDLTRLLPGTSRSMRRLEKIAGRSDDMISVRGVNAFPSQFEEQILRVRGLAAHYRCEVSRVGRLDEVTLRVEAAEGRAGDGEAGDGGARMAAELRRRVKDGIGISVGVEILAPGTLERSTGKADRVLDHRGHTGAVAGPAGS